ncbi:hypothetical protein KAR28_00180 [Candidatus Parcubacteria bacterium]|nr:hypothetical protein [Candidatus Parcubacteria bacterium]
MKFLKPKNLTVKIGAIILLLGLLIAPSVQAIDLGIGYAENIGLASAGDEDIRDTAVGIIQYLLTFLGIIAVGIILYGGFVWMTAGGNEDRVAKAKKIITAGAIGLIIVISAFAITSFVIEMTENAINGGF